MAKNTKGDGSLEQNGSTVVTPDNIGQGIKWNPATKKYDVQIAQNQPIIINDNGELEVRVSRLEGNLLQLRKDGLYYGEIAEQAAYYIDAVNGDDNNIGTRDKPMRTFLAAVKKIPAATNNVHIYLKEDQVHDCPTAHITVNATYTVEGYGETHDRLAAQWNENKTGWFVYACDELAPHRPILNAVATDQLNYQVGTDMYFAMLPAVATGQIVKFFGVAFKITLPEGRRFTDNIHHNCLIKGGGSRMFVDCTFMNKDWDGKCGIATNVDQTNASVMYRRISLESTDPRDAITLIWSGSSFVVGISDYEATRRDHFSGLHWKQTTPLETIKTSVHGADNNVPQSIRYKTNF